MGDQVLITSTLSENASLPETIRWLKAFADTVQSASGRNLIQNVNASGAALSSLKNAQANQFPYFTGPTSVALGILPAVSVMDTPFGAKGDGITDDTAAIQNAINSFSGPGVVLFPAGKTFKYSSQLTLGNGTSSAVSTIQGVYLQGLGVPGAYGAPFFNGYPTTAPRLFWAGPTNSSMIGVAGPLHGWGVRNLVIDGNNVSGVNGLSVISAGHGDCANLEIVGCAAGIASSSYPLGGYSGVGNVDSARNNWTNIDIVVPNVPGAKGILLNGESGGTSNTDYNTFTNCFVRLIAGANTTFGIYLSVTDSNVFNSLNVSGGGATAVNIAFDYSTNNNFPNGNLFYGVDSNGPGAQWQVFAGSPSAGALAAPNSLYGISRANAQAIPNIVNLITYDSTWASYTPTVSASSGTFTSASATGRYTKSGKTVHVEVSITLTTIGTAANTLVVSLPFTPNTAATGVGRELSVNGKTVSVTLASGINTMNIQNYDNTSCIVASATFVVSATYEAQ